MLTLKELKKIVKVADMEKRIPSVKSLKEHKVVVKEMINEIQQSLFMITDMYFIQQEINQPYFHFIVVMTMNM